MAVLVAGSRATEPNIDLGHATGMAVAADATREPTDVAGPAWSTAIPSPA